MIKKKDIASGIVLFNPDLKRLKENLDSITIQCDKVLLIDNFSKNIEEIKILLDSYSNVELICFEKNEGIAYALNKIVQETYRNYKWLLTLDQDSVCFPQLISKYIEFINNNKNINIACLTCMIIDRNFDNLNKIKRFETINYCITSGSLIDINIIKEIGSFDNKMFIDKVDTELCIKIIKNNYKIIRIPYVGLLHEIGHAKLINLGIRKWELYNHQPIRRYYMCRNASYLLKKYHNFYTLKIFLKEVFQVFLVLIFENRKIKKFLISIKGLLEGFFI